MGSSHTKLGHTSEDQDVCARCGVDPVVPDPGDKIGLSRSARAETPVHGVRVNPTAGNSGWFVWAGEMSESEDFFEVTHVSHLSETCPRAVPFLGLPPGWRFMTDGDHVDVWFDPDVEL